MQLKIEEKVIFKVAFDTVKFRDFTFLYCNIVFSGDFISLSGVVPIVL